MGNHDHPCPHCHEDMRLMGDLNHEQNCSKRPPALVQKPIEPSPVHCEHANECPHICPCPPTCYCWQPGNTCGHQLQARPIEPGDILLDTDLEKNFVLWIEGEKALVLHLDDGMSRTWMLVKDIQKWRKLHAKGFLQHREKQAEQRSKEAIFSEGLSSALNYARTAGQYRLLEQIASALKAPR